MIQESFKRLDKRKFENIGFDYLYEYYKEHNYLNIQKEDTFIVWSNYILGNRKMLMSSNIDNMYFEFTYSVNKNEIYVDVYKQTKNEVLKHE